MDKNAQTDDGGRWVYKPEDQNSGQTPEQSDEDKSPVPVTDNTAATTWTASEYIEHNKGFGWYALLFLAAVVLAAAAYLISRDIVSTAAIGVIAVIFAVAAARKPRVLTYRLDESGLTIGQKFYPYNNFKSFTLVQQGAFPSITFMPLKRFMPSLSIYFAPGDQQKILDALSKHLPMEQSQGELVDRLMHRLRF